MRILLKTCASLLACSLPLPSHGAEPLPEGYSVDAPQAQAQQGRVKASVSAVAAASCASAWSVFTDYDAMPSFLPGVESSHAVFHARGQATLRQTGSAQAGLFSRGYSSERELTLIEHERVDSQSAPSDELDLSSSTTFSPLGQGCRIRYAIDAQAPSWAPGFLAARFAKSMALSQMNAMLREVHRRQGAAKEP